MRYANIYIYIFVLHRGFFQQPRGRVAPRLGRAPQLDLIFVRFRALFCFPILQSDEFMSVFDIQRALYGSNDATSCKVVYRSSILITPCSRITNARN